MRTRTKTALTTAVEDGDEVADVEGDVVFVETVEEGRVQGRRSTAESLALYTLLLFSHSGPSKPQDLQRQLPRRLQVRRVLQDHQPELRQYPRRAITRQLAAWAPPPAQWEVF